MTIEKGLAATSPEANHLHKKSTTKNDGSQIKIIHVMADGSIRDSIAGYEVPVNDRTITAYRLIAEHVSKKDQ